ncbi:ribosomal RNA-processing protein 8 [Diplocarpon rosae]|nr:ribosomal RNA-processing protein 8 [Diplocarpon rosae]
MFATPGWSVSSSLLREEKPETTLKVKEDKPKSKSKKPEQDEVPDIAGEAESNRIKKRKRSAENNKNAMLNARVNPANIEELWETVIEGKPREDKEGKKHGEKRRKTKGAPTVEAAEGKENAASDIKIKKSNKGAEKVSRDSTEPKIEGQGPAPKEKFKKEGKTMKEKKREKKAKLKAIADGTLALTETSKELLPTPPTASQPYKPTLTPLQASMRQKLISARFRHLNQTLYTTPSAHSLSLFAENPEMFSEYHEGFRRQVEVWPENPVDGYLAQILARGKIKGPHRGNPLNKATKITETALPRTESICTIADLGCGDAALATALQSHLKSLKLKIHSFDLQSPSSLVTKADIANLPLIDGTVDIAIFCLALMGTNWVDFIEEAFRILRWKGELWVAEIKSRFGRVTGAGKKVVEHSVGNRKRPLDKKAKKAADEAADDDLAAVEVDGQEDRGGETDVSAFVEVLRKRGFVLKGEGTGAEKESVDLRNKMFVRMVFIKGATPIKGKGVPAPKGAGEFEKGGMWKRKAPQEKSAEEVHVSSEAVVLKPCVYKLR